MPGVTDSVGGTPTPNCRSARYKKLRSQRKVTLLLLALAIVPGTSLAQIDGSSSRSNTPKERSDWLTFVVAAEGGFGLDSRAADQPSVMAGVKLGMSVAVRGEYPYQTLRTCTLDLAYDRVQSRNGFGRTVAHVSDGAFPWPADRREPELRENL